MGCGSSRPRNPNYGRPQGGHSTSGKHAPAAMSSYNTHHTSQNMPLPPPPAARGRTHATRAQNPYMPATTHHQRPQHRKHAQPPRTHAERYAGPRGRSDQRRPPDQWFRGVSPVGLSRAAPGSTFGKGGIGDFDKGGIGRWETW